MTGWKTKEGYDIPSALAMWGFLAIGIIVGIAADSMAVMIAFGLIGIAIKATAIAGNRDLGR